MNTATININELNFTTREEYLTWRLAWRIAYRSLSDLIRRSKANRRATESVCAKGESKVEYNFTTKQWVRSFKYPAFEEEYKKIAEADKLLDILATELSVKRWDTKATATAMLEVRKASKIRANECWRSAHGMCSKE